jgi:hypothetical protein
MALDYKNFLRPISPGDRYIQVIKDNVVIHTINPFSIENIYVSANLVKVNLKSDKLILLDFYNITESRAALLILQSQIDTLKSNIPYYVSKDVENYVTSEIDKNMSNLIGPTGPQGATGSFLSENFGYGNILFGDDISGITTSTDFRYSSQSIFLSGLTVSAQEDFIYTSKFLTDNLSVGSVSITSDTESLILSGNILPSSNLTFNLGSSESRWNDLYVRDVFAASQSIYLGDVKLEGIDNRLRVNSISADSMIMQESLITASNSNLYMNGMKVTDRYSATSSTPLQIREVGFSVTMSVNKYLSITPMQSLLVYNTLVDNALPDDYVEGENPASSDSSIFFTGKVDSYIPDTGILSLVIDKSVGYGLTDSNNEIVTYSFWYLNLIGEQGPQGSVNLPTSASYSVLLSDGLSGVTVSNNLRFIDTNKLKIIGTTELQQTIEVVNEGIDGATVSYDYNLGSIWIHDQNLTQNYTANFQNLPYYDMGEFKAISLTIVINQGADAWIPTDFQNDGNPITVKWVNGYNPVGNASQTDVISLTLLSSFLSLGNFTTFY